MSYSTIATIATNAALYRRLTAAAAQEQKPKPYEQWVTERVWDFAATPGWSDAWESAVAGGIADPGSDAGVITDGMILAAVQPME